jgi:hypothetical protein
LYLDVNQTKKLDLILECNIVGLSLYLIMSIDLNVPYNFASIEEMILPTNKT